MERKDSVTLTKQIIRKATCGKEIADAIRAHFREFKSYKKESSPAYTELLDVLNAPLVKSG